MEVHKLYDIIIMKTKEAGVRKPDLNEEFTKLREITHNYKVPSDVCESYEAVYHRFILSKKNQITLMGGILIIIGFMSGLGFKNESLAMWSFAIASILGVAPIAI
ncbi:MAG TPA: hypothetical protein VJZ04_00450, partial [Lachnospiraceae bacterium]|nr:hypothetical protein [Lachnospiraceae bacterium]